MNTLRPTGVRWVPYEGRFEEAGLCQEMLNRLKDASPASLSTIATYIGQFAQTNTNAVLKIILLNLHRKEVDMMHRLNMYYILQRALKESIQISSPTSKAIISISSRDMRSESQDMSYTLQHAASDSLVALSHHYFNEVMFELQGHLVPLALPPPFIVITLAKLASVNVFRTVPFLVTTMIVMQSMLSLATTNQMKKAFCTALESFSEAIAYYLMNKDKGPYLGLSKNNFSISYAYRIVEENWLHNRVSEVKMAAIRAIGPMTMLLPDHKLEMSLKSMFPLILKHCNEDKGNYHVTKTLQDLIITAANNKRHILEKGRKAIFAALLSQIMVSPTNNPDQNYIKAMECFLQLANLFPDSLLSFAEANCRKRNVDLLLGTLNLLEEIVKADLSVIKNRMQLVVKDVRLTLRSNFVLVKLSILRVIREMANHGFLKGPHGSIMVEYVVQQCAASTKSMQLHQAQLNLPPVHEDQRLQEASTSLLEHLTVTIPFMTDILWPRLLSFVILPDYTSILTPLCNNLALLALRKQKEGAEDEQLEYRGKVQIPPSPYSLLARLLVIASVPNERGGQGLAALKLLYALKINMHSEVGPMWDKEIPALVKWLKDTPDSSLDIKEWEHKLLKFLGKSLTFIHKSASVSLLSTEMCAQMGFYSGKSLEKCFLYKAIGLTLTICGDNKEVRRLLETVLQKANFAQKNEREGIISMIGMCAESHLDLVLHFTDELKDTIENEQDSGLLGYLQNLQSRRAEKMMSTLMLMFGSIAIHADKEMLLTRVELQIANQVLQLYGSRRQVLGVDVTYQDLTFTVSFVKSISLISRAICDSGHVKAFHFSKKMVIVNLMLDLINAEPAQSLASPIRYRAMTALKDLSKLKPYLTQEEMNNVIDISVKSIFSLPILESLMSEGETPADKEHIKVIYGLSMQSLGNLLMSFLQHSLSPQQLRNIFDRTEMWIVSEKKWERERAIQISAQLLTSYSQTFIPGEEPAKFTDLGYLIALFAPHISDPMASIQKYSLECIYQLGCLQRMYQGMLRAPQVFSVERKSMKSSATAAIDIAMYVSRYLEVSDFLDFANTIFDSLISEDDIWAKSAAVWLKIMTEEMAPRLEEQVSEIIELMYMQLHLVKIEEVRTTVLKTLEALAHYHHGAVLHSLLMKPFPFDRDSSDLWKSLASEPLLSFKTLTLLMNIVNHENESMSCNDASPEEDQPVAALEPLKAVCAIHEVLQATSSPVVKNLFPDLFCTLLAEVSHTLDRRLEPATFISRKRAFHHGVSSESLNPCSLSVDALQCLLSYRNTDEVSLENIDRNEACKLLKNVERHCDGVMQIARDLIVSHSAVVKDVILCLLPSLDSTSVEWRVTVTAFFAELMGHRVLRGMKILKKLIKNMKKKSLDPNYTVRCMAVRGLGRVSAGSTDKVIKYKHDILKALLHAVSHSQDVNFMKEGFQGLVNTIQYIQKKDLGSYFDHLAMQCQSCMDSMDEELRASSIKIFGHLASEAPVNPSGTFAGRVAECVPILLLRLKDPTIEVYKACEFTLRCCMPFLPSQGLQSTLNHHPVILQHNMEAFLQEFCMNLVQDLPELVQGIVAYCILKFQTQHEPEEIRCTATLLIAHTVKSMRQWDLNKLDLKLLYRSLHALRKDPSIFVQQGALQALRVILKTALSDQAPTDQVPTDQAPADRSDPISLNSHPM